MIYLVDAGRMHRDGYRFYLSANGVWLTKVVPCGLPETLVGGKYGYFTAMSEVALRTTNTRRSSTPLEAIPAQERTPEMDSELARAYNNLADHSKPEGRKLLKKAIALLEPHEEYFAGDHYWNYRIGYSYFYLDQEGRALRYFEKALEALPDDEDTKQFIEWCREGYFPAPVLGVLPGEDGICVGELCRAGSSAAPDYGCGREQ